MVGIGATGADEWALIFSRGAFDWRATLIANGSGDLLKRTEALVTDGNAGGFGEHAVADAAAGWRKYAEQSGGSAASPR
jgi:hypothetical protein